MSDTSKPSEPPLSWERKDIEQRMFFKGAKHTRVNSFFSAIRGLILAILFYAALIPLKGYDFADMFTQQGYIPYMIVFFGFWSMAILAVKTRKLALQKKTLEYRVIPKDLDSIRSAGNVVLVVDNIYRVVDEPKNFVLFNRIAVALSNLKNLGRVGDVGEILNSQAEQDEAAVDTSYSILNGFIWAIPVLGFIGTVLGLSSAIGAFGSVLQTTEDIAQIKNALKDVTGGLSTAFITTLQALVVALLLQLWMTFQKKSEEEFLENCSEYCTRYVVNRLRILPFEAKES